MASKYLKRPTDKMLDEVSDQSNHPDRYELATKKMQRGYRRSGSSKDQHHTKSWTTTDHDLDVTTRIRTRLFQKGIEPSRSEIINVAITLAEEASDATLIEAIQERRS